MNAALQIARDYCRGCETTSRQRFAGWAADGSENGVRPRAFYRTCERCGTQRLVLGDVNDAEGLCRVVLKRWLSARTTGAKVAATDRPFGDGALDAEDALSFLQGEVWQLYNRWLPTSCPFLAYATELLPRRLATWSRDASGEPQTRAKGRKFPKAHAASVSVSLDGIRESARDGGEGGVVGDAAVAKRQDGLADPRFGGFTVDDAEARPAALLRVLATGRREGARDHGGACLADLEAAPATDGQG